MLKRRIVTCRSLIKYQSPYLRATNSTSTKSSSTSSNIASSKRKHIAPASVISKNVPSQPQEPIEALDEPEFIPPGLRGRPPPLRKIDVNSQEYKSTARRVTLAIIAAPIAIVTSYVLAMRMWGGAEQKTFKMRDEEKQKEKVKEVETA